MKKWSNSYFSKGYTSISEIKEYFDCPYKHFLSRGLKLKKVDPLKMRNIDVGNILHRIAEVYCKSLKTNVNKTKILEQVLGEFEEVIKVTSPIILKGLKKEALRLMGAVENYVASSDYMPTFFEYNFPNMKLNLETKYGQLEVRGKIDRIDVCKDRFLLIDYKTSNMEFDSKGLYYGTKLQLPFYSYFFDKNTDKRLSGFAYFPIVDNFESEKVVNYKNKFLRIFKTKDGKAYFVSSRNHYYRLFHFVENAVTFQTAEDDKMFENAGYTIGTFLNLLSDFPADQLNETILNFHNTAIRYQTFLESLKADKLNRAATCKEEINFVLEHKDITHQITDLLETKQMPIRVIHNDTKLNNIMFDFNNHDGL